MRPGGIKIQFPDWSGKKFLIADDAPENLRLLEILLKKTNVNITTASDGEDALTKFNGSKFDLVVLDIHMPKMSGIDVLKSIKGVDKTNKVIAFTGTSSPDSVSELLKEGSDSYLQKPIALNSILNSFSKMLN